MICTLDANNFCKKHRRRHIGHAALLAVSPDGEKHRRLWDGHPGGGVPAKPKPLLRSLPLAKQCVHLGTENPPEKKNCGNCSTWDCDIHGKVKLTYCTQECGDWQQHKTICTDTKDIVPRHLLFHLWPKKTSQGTWQRNLDQLKQRWSLFTGKRVIAVATSSDSHDLAAVQSYMRGYECEWIHVENDHNLREVKTFLPLFERVEGLPGYTFYAQGKGVTKPINPGVSIHKWTAAMYEILLDYWPLVEDNLKRFPVVGVFKKNVAGFTGSSSSWHLSGSYFWVRNDDLFSKSNWRRIDNVWYGIESYPSLHYSREECGCLFYERSRQFSLYSMKQWANVENELHEWRDKNRIYRWSALNHKAT